MEDILFSDDRNECICMPAMLLVKDFPYAMLSSWDGFTVRVYGMGHFPICVYGMALTGLHKWDGLSYTFDPY